MATWRAVWSCFIFTLHTVSAFQSFGRSVGANLEVGQRGFLQGLEDEVNASALARLHKLREEPLYGIDLNASHVPDAGSLDRAAFEAQSGQPVTVVAYHKTGYEFSDELLKIRSNLTGERYTRASHLCSDAHAAMWCTPLDQRLETDLQLVVIPPAGFTLPAKAPTIHFVRHPVDLVLSAYRYHRQTPERWEKLTESGTEAAAPPQCFMCNDSDWQTIFGLCSEECGYYDLLQGIPDEEGILVEAIGMRGQTQMMLSNLLAWASDPNVLHLSVAHLAADYDKTMRCVENFLGARGLGPESLPALDALRTGADPHVTAGKFDNTDLENVLISVSAWAQEFTSAQQVLSKIFERQGAHYDCPVP